ncbi:MAG: DUF4870 domain-containing protein [Saccharofermentanales bacterium]
MAFCVKCGNQLGNEGMFCTSCGEAVNSTEQSKEQLKPLKEQTIQEEPPKDQQAPQGKQTAGPQSQFEEKLNKLNETADTTDSYDKTDIEQNKVMAILAYIGILFLVQLIAAPQSKFARFHANQGLVLAICEAGFSVAYSILNFIILGISWRLGFLMTIIGLLWLVFIALAILGIMNASNGKAKELPVIGKYKILK